MRIIKTFSVGLVAVAITAAGTPALAKPKDKGPAAPTVTQVVVYLKDELRRFNQREGQTVPADPASVCGGNVSLDIARFDVEIATTTTKDASGNISVEVPIGSTKATGEFGKGNKVEHSSTLNISFDPLGKVGKGMNANKILNAAAGDGQPDRQLFEPGALSNSLIGLEKSLREAALMNRASS